MSENSLTGFGAVAVDHLVPERVAVLRKLEAEYGRPLVPDTVVAGVTVSDPGSGERLRQKLGLLRPDQLRPILGDIEKLRLAPDWNSLALFFNLPVSRRPSGYQSTDGGQVRAWLDEGANPASPTLSHFVQDYWRAVSYGHLNLGVAVPRGRDGSPLIPTVEVAADDWVELAKACIAANPVACWEAAGRRTKDGRRWIPSVVVVQHYATHASAWFSGWRQTVDGVEYEVGDVTHVGYDLSWVTIDGVTTTTRNFWATLTHEFGHNFLEFGDLYGPSGCTGYWDLLGDNTPPTRMSEISSVFKVRAGWMGWTREINGPHTARQHIALRPFSSSGEAIKVVPDPEHTPHEYFLLEFRRSLGSQAWRPDGGLLEAGLLITHINDRLGIPSTWMLREAPFFDPEFADASDGGSTQWTGWDRLAGALYPQPGNDSFTDSSGPSSRLYGNRSSGLAITGVRVVGSVCHFDLEIAGSPRVGWVLAASDRSLAGDFTGDGASNGDQIILRNPDHMALVCEQQAQFVVVGASDDWVGEWNLGGEDRELVGDLDGDGVDEIYVRSPEWAGVLEWQGTGFHSVTVQHDWVGQWNLAADNRELLADLNGDGRDEIYVRSPDWAGVLALQDGTLQSLSVQNDWVGEWNLAADNTEYVGRFTRRDRDEILVRSPDWAGLISWDETARALTAPAPQHGWVDGWNLGGDNWHTIADLDGDGLDEVYVRSPDWAGIWKWRDGRFQVLWMTQGNIEHLSLSRPEDRLRLHASDASSAGRFLPDRDGIVHVGADGRLAILTWQDGQMRVRYYLNSPLENRWTASPSQRLVTGRFQRSGPDISEPANDYVSDVTASAFIIGDQGSATVGVNYFERPGGDPISECGLTWVSRTQLMQARRVGGTNLTGIKQSAKSVKNIDSIHRAGFKDAPDG